MVKETSIFAPCQVPDAVDILRSGKLLAFAIETVYGLGADAKNGDAVAKIYLA